MKLNKKHYNIIFCVFLSFLGVVFCVFPKTVSEGAYNGIMNCINCVIPSLFPFSVLSLFLTESGYFKKIFYFPSVFISKLFRIDKSYCSLFFIGLIGGYHCAAKSVSLLVKRNLISPFDAKYIISFSTNAGPAFLISAIGAGMFLSRDIGVILYIAGVLSSFTLLAIYAPKIKYFNRKLSFKSNNIANSLITSVKESCNAMCIMSAFIVLFSVLISFVSNVSFNSKVLKALVFGFFEVTNGCLAGATETSFSSILVTSAICSFGGLCVMFQILAMCIESKIDFKPFVLSRLLHTVFSVIYTFLLVLIFPIETKQTFISNSSGATVSVFSSPLPALFLLICCISFPIYLTRQKNL